MAKIKYVEGWLCRDRFKNMLAGTADEKEWLTFHEEECILSQSSPGQFYWDSIGLWHRPENRVWSVEVFEGKYSFNFDLPKPGKKVKIWIEL